MIDCVLTISSTFRIVMLGLAPSTTEIMVNCKLAREMSQTSTVYYQGWITQISKLLSVKEQPGRQAKWRTIRAELTQEWELAPSQGGGAQAEEGEGQCRGGEVVGERRINIWG